MAYMTAALLLITSALGQTNEPVRLLVPAYFPVSPGNPEDGLPHWNRLIVAHQKQRSEVIAIVNVGSGWTENPQNAIVGGGPNIPTGWDAAVTRTRYTDVLGRAAGTGVGLIGYVSTRGGKRPIAHAKKDIDSWVTWPGITGIFLDEQATGTPDNPAAATNALPYYKELRAHALKVFRSRRRGAGIDDNNLAKPLIVTNPGNVGSKPEDLRGYLSDGKNRTVADIMVIREDKGSEFPAFAPPSFMKGFKPNRFAMLLHAVPQLKYINMAVNEKGIRNVYVTDEPWGRLPPYWEAEVTAVRNLKPTN